MYLRIYSNNIDASPQQIVTNTDPSANISCIRYVLTNPNSVNAWFKFYDDTSGIVNTSGVVDYGPILVPANSQVIDGVGFNQNNTTGNLNYDLFIFHDYLTARATSTAEGILSLPFDCCIEIYYYYS